MSVSFLNIFILSASAKDSNTASAAVPSSRIEFVKILYGRMAKSFNTKMVAPTNNIDHANKKNFAERFPFLEAA